MTNDKQYPVTLSSEEYLQLVRAMQHHHAIFYELWLMGKPYFTDKIPTAAVAFDQEGDLLTFLLNYNFWESLTFEQKKFVVAHECWHVAMNHGMRGMGKGFINSNDNKAMDLVVNHTLVDAFGFDRAQIDPDNKYCWIDTVFREHAGTIKKNETFEYYLIQLKKLFPEKNETGGNGDAKSADNTSGGEVLDDHSFSDFSDVLEEIGERLSDEDKETLRDLVNKHIDDPELMNRGTSAGGAEYLIKPSKIKHKKKWETIIKKWMHKCITMMDRDSEQWLRTNRRLALMNVGDSDLILPSEFEIEDMWEDKKKIVVYFFQDTSGSCISYADRFFNAAASLPPDKFDVKLFCFDTNVYETTLKSKKIYGGGGTSFSIIETFIQSYIKKHNLLYPEKCFIITDGFGNMVSPEKPENWDWFLTKGGSVSYIPKKSKIHKLEEFE